MNYLLKIVKSYFTALLFVAMFITALLAVSIGVVVGGIFELIKAVSHPMPKYGKAAPLVDVAMAKR